MSKELIKVEIALESGRIPRVLEYSPEVVKLLRAYLPHPELVFIPSPSRSAQDNAKARKLHSRRAYYLRHSMTATGMDFRRREDANKLALARRRRP